MRFGPKTMVVMVASGGLVWMAILIFHIGMDDYGSGRKMSAYGTNKQDLLMDKVDKLDKELAKQLEQNTILLKLLKEQLRLKTERRHQGKLKSSEAIKEGATVLPVLVMACNRVTVSRCLDKLIKYRPSKNTFPIIISQDCNHEPTYEVLKRYVDESENIYYIKQPDQSEIPLMPKQKKFQGYYRISRHYKFALSHVLDEKGYDDVIIVEDDLEISRDFYEYFLGTYPLLKMDPTLWCVSAWNDNGKPSLIDLSSPQLLYRTDFFPGLGWLLQAKHWRVFKEKWPAAFFDDWLRESNQTGGLSCIRPEISRTNTFGKEGVSKGMYFDRHLRFIKLNEKFVPFTKMNLEYLLKSNYDELLSHELSSAVPLTIDQVKKGSNPELSPVKIIYHDNVSFKQIARALGLMDDFRSGVARTIYNGVVTCFYKNRRVLIAPASPFSGYDKSWS